LTPQGQYDPTLLFQSKYSQLYLAAQRSSIQLFRVLWEYSPVSRSTGACVRTPPTLRVYAEHGYRKTIKRVVITSSIGAVSQSSDPDDTIYTENNWNDEAIREVEEKGEKVDSDDLYYASKTLAERGRVTSHLIALTQC
jgi:hypothetical protein